MTTPINDGGPAFPLPPVGTGDPRDGMAGGSPGMSLRAWFAGQAMNGILSQSPAGLFAPKRSIWEACFNHVKEEKGSETYMDDFAEIVAETSVVLADKLIAELEKGTK